MSELSRILGRPVTLQLEGVTLRFSRLNDTIRTNLEEWIEGRVRGALKKAQEISADPAHAREVADALLHGDYEFGKPKFMEIISTPAGAFELARQLLLQHQPDITPDDVVGLMTEYGDEVGAALKKAMEGDPNRSAARKPKDAEKKAE